MRVIRIPANRECEDIRKKIIKVDGKESYSNLTELS